MTAARSDRFPFETVLRLRTQDDYARAFGGPLILKQRESAKPGHWSPTVDIYEDADRIVIRADMPGVDQSDIDIEMADETLTIRGERKIETTPDGEKYVRRERRFGSFQRSFAIGVPVMVDEIKASYRNGVLELTVPKAEAAKPKKVLVSAE
jgi:HSP20 family protein